MTSISNDLFAALKLADVTVCNRLAVAPMTRVSATEDGYPTDEMLRYYERFAKGNFGLIITEGLYTDQAYSQGYIFQPGISDKAQALAWKGFVESIHKTPTKVIAQLMHAGALNQGNNYKNGTIAPSAVQPKGEQMAFYYGKGKYPVPSEISDGQIADAIAGFANAAKLATEVAGFDGVEIHGANGYLLDQFLTDYTNDRTDQWGGDVRNRFALTLETVKLVKASVKPGSIVGVRISQGKVNDYTHKWSEGTDAAEVIFGSLAGAGVDYIHVTDFEAWQPAFPGGSDSLAQLAKRYAPGITVIANGSLHQDDRAKEQLDRGIDLVAMGRGALSNPDLPMRFAAGEPLAEFDSAILGPIANIKEQELFF